MAYQKMEPWQHVNIDFKYLELNSMVKPFTLRYNNKRKYVMRRDVPSSNNWIAFIGNSLGEKMSVPYGPAFGTVSKLAETATIIPKDNITKMTNQMDTVKITKEDGFGRDSSSVFQLSYSQKIQMMKSRNIYFEEFSNISHEILGGKKKTVNQNPNKTTNITVQQTEYKNRNKYDKEVAEESSRGQLDYGKPKLYSNEKLRGRKKTVIQNTNTTANINAQQTGYKNRNKYDKELAEESSRGQLDYGKPKLYFNEKLRRRNKTVDVTTNVKTQQTGYKNRNKYDKEHVEESSIGFCNENLRGRKKTVDITTNVKAQQTKCKKRNKFDKGPIEESSSVQSGCLTRGEPALFSNEKFRGRKKTVNQNSNTTTNIKTQKQECKNRPKFDKEPIEQYLWGKSNCLTRGKPALFHGQKKRVNVCLENLLHEKKFETDEKNKTLESYEKIDTDEEKEYIATYKINAISTDENSGNSEIDETKVYLANLEHDFCFGCKFTP